MHGGFPEFSWVHVGGGESAEAGAGPTAVTPAVMTIPSNRTATRTRAWPRPPRASGEDRARRREEFHTPSDVRVTSAPSAHRCAYGAPHGENGASQPSCTTSNIDHVAASATSTPITEGNIRLGRRLLDVEPRNVHVAPHVTGPGRRTTAPVWPSGIAAFSLPHGPMPTVRDPCRIPPLRRGCGRHGIGRVSVGGFEPVAVGPQSQRRIGVAQSTGDGANADAGGGDG